MDVSILQDIGLTNAQIKSYLALLSLGETTSGGIIRKSKLQSSVVYNALNRLIENGLVSFVYKGKRKYFIASNPKNLIRFVEDKKDKLKELIPQLLSTQELIKKKHEARVFLGWKGVYNAFNIILDTLPKGSEYIGFAAGFDDQFSKQSQQFFREFQKKRTKMRYRVKLITNRSEKTKVEKYEYYPTFGKPQYKYVEGFSLMGVIIFGDNVLNVAFEDTPVAVITTSEQIAKSYRNFFNAMWKVSKK